MDLRSALLLGTVFDVFLFSVAAFLQGILRGSIAGLLGEQDHHRQYHWLHPLRYVDLVGLVFVIFFSVGWSKPLPFSGTAQQGSRLRFFLTGLVATTAIFHTRILVILGCLFTRG